MKGPIVTVVEARSNTSIVTDFDALQKVELNFPSGVPNLCIATKSNGGRRRELRNVSGCDSLHGCVTQGKYLLKQDVTKAIRPECA